MKSTSTEPSIPAVVLDTIDTVIAEQGEEETEDTFLAGSDSAINTTESKSDDIAKEDKKKEGIPARQSSVSELVNNLEKMREAKENEDVDKRSTSPRRRSSGSVTLSESSKEGSVSPRDRKKVSIDEGKSIPEETKVSVTNVVKKDSFKKAMGREDEKREMEVQSVKVKIDDDDEVASSNIDDIITINGQPVPAASTIVLNGHISKIKDIPQNEVEWRRQRSESPSSVGSRGSSKARDLVPQTDLDTFETRITNSGEPLDISNPDDDSSDQRSDTGSINTVDSVDKEETKQSPAPRKHIRQKNDKVR